MSFGGFGSSGFGSNNNSSTNRTGSLFGGGGGGFGSNTNTSNTGFGASSNTGFGANNTSGGSLFGGNNTNNNPTSSGFGSGGFGSNNNTSNNTTSLFGGGNNNSSSGSLFGNNANNASGGFGSGGTGFGANSNTNTSSGFGSNTTGGLFGNKSNTTSTGFGNSTTANAGGSSLFGGGNASTGFGSSNTNSGIGFGSGTGFGSGGSNAPGQNPGTGGTPFQPVIEADGVGSMAKVHYQTIAFQEPYKSWSFQELRQQDYDQGRRFGNNNGQAGAFGAAPTFGGASNNTSTGAFGSTGTSTGFGGGFGANNNTSSGFGASNNTGFGSNNSGGLFGNQTTKPATPSLFGSTATSAPSGGGLFGSSNNNTGGGGFGSSNTGGGAFGGASNTGFGASAGGFASNNSSNTGGLFGNQNTSAQSGGFGTGFGQQNQQSNQNTSTSFGGGIGAANNNQPKSLFGGNNSTTGSSLFGNNNQQNNQPANPSPFGGANNTNSTSGSLFGQQQPKPATGGGLFGMNNTTNTGGGGLFGNNNTNNNAQPVQPANNSMFGSKPSLFGGSTANNNNAGAGGLFGTNSANNQQPNNNASLFGNSNNSQPNNGDSLFGNTQQPQQLQQSQQPQQLIASINSANPYGHEQLFANLGSPQQAVGPLATPLSSSQKPRRPAPLPTYKLNPAASARLITPQKRSGYGFSYSTYGTPGSAYGSPSPYSGSLLGAGYGGRTLNKSVSMGSLRSSYSGEESMLNPNAFSPNPRSARGSGSMKRLQINRNLRTDLFGNNESTEGARASPLRKNVSFEDQAPGGSHGNGQSSSALVRLEERDSATPTAEEMGYLRSARSQTNEPSPARELEQVNGKELATVPEDGSPDVPVASKEQDMTTAKAHRDHDDLDMGAYWMSPSEKQLKKMSRSGLAAVENLTVGRVGAGQVTFFQCDLTNVDISAIPGEIVVFKLRSATVYPEHLNKPTEGQGLNVPAIVTLANSWPRSHGGKVKVFDKKGPKFEKHLDRMRRLKNTQFVDYNADTGEWTFRVEHFSSYGLEYDDDEPTMSSLRNSSHSSSSPLTGRGARHGRDDGLDDSMLTDGSANDADDTFEFKRGHNMPGLFDDDNTDPPSPNRMNQGFEHGSGFDSQYVASETDLSLPGNRDDEIDHSGFGGSPEAEVPPYGLDGQIDTGSPRHSPPMMQSLKPKSILKVSQQPRSIFGTPSRTKHILDEDNWAERLQRTLSPKKQNRQALRETQGTISHAQISSHQSTRHVREERPFTNSIDIMNSLYGKGTGSSTGMKQTAGDRGFKWPYPKRNKTQNDSGPGLDSEKLFRSSVKPSWSLDGVLLPLRSSSNTRRSTAQDSDVRAVALLPQMPPSQSFDEFRQLTTIEVVDQVPRALLNGNFAFSAFASRAADADPSAQNEEIMWQLAQILFDSQDPAADEQLKRKQILTKFWKSITTSAALDHARSAKTAEERAIAQLSAFDIWSATETLLKGGDPRLATMIAQIGSSEATRKAVAEQLNHWRDENDLSEIPPDVRTLYELLAGNTCVAQGKSGAGPENKAESFNISSKFGMDWRRSFGLKLWYGIGDDDSITEAVELYDNDLSGYREKVRPVPWFVSAEAQTGRADPSAGDRQDILWGLLKLYNHHQALQYEDEDTRSSIDIAALLAPESISGNPLSTRLAFQLYHTLCARSLLPSNDRASDESGNAHFADALTETLASQLSSSPHTLNLAVFTLMYLSSAPARVSAIKSLLTHHAGAIGPDPDTCPTFHSLTTDLKVPAAWIYSAKAVFERSVSGDRAAQALNLLRAGEVNQAHDVLTRAVAPLCVIEERVIGPSPDHLKEVLKEFKKSDAVHLPVWKRGGGVYSDFADIVEFAPGLADGSGSETDDARIRPGTQQDLKRLCKRVRATLPARASERWKSMGLEERAACEEMRDVVAKAEAALEKQKGGEGTNQFGDDGTAVKGKEDEALKSAKASSEVFYSRFARAAGN